MVALPIFCFVTPHSSITTYCSWWNQAQMWSPLVLLLTPLSNRLQRNKFLEAESVQMDKERNQLRFEMRGLLVRNEDLLQINTQLQGEMRKMMEMMAELEGGKSAMSTHIRQLEVWQCSLWAWESAFTNNREDLGFISNKNLYCSLIEIIIVVVIITALFYCY